jgi:hypothetical protein
MEWAAHVARVGVMKNIVHTKFKSEKPKGRDIFEDLRLHGRIILENESYEIACEDVDWNQIAQDIQAFVNTVMKFLFTQKDESY